MIIIGLTGGIGMGKSAVADILRDAGIPVHDADAAVHRLMQKGGSAVPEIAQYFPACVKDGAVDRAALGALIFGAEGGEAERQERRHLLERIVHPLVRAEEEVFLHEHEQKGARAIVLEIPLLFETGADKRCHKVICVTASSDVQRERVLQRPGMTREKFEKIVADQMSDYEKTGRADFVVHTDRPREETREQVQHILKSLELI
ncbi:MAG: dephospho-CoA kinase [Alphaproteobacteria bacterium]|nr:dephospho-CoA kinase [Alphaproteobacteria bacterium]